MQRLRDLLRSLEEGQARPTARPNSLYEAGRVGSAPAQQLVRRDVQQDAIVDSAAEPTAEERTTRRERPVTERRRPIAQTPQAGTPAAQRIRAALRDPESLRTAIMLREVLDSPVSRRPPRR